MNFDQERVFAHEFLKKLMAAFHTQCPESSSNLFGLLALAIGEKRDVAVSFAKKHRVSKPDELPKNFVELWRHIGNELDKGRRQKSKS